MDLSLPSPPAVSALRDTFGDRKPPNITRKITACVACRKQKVVVHLNLNKNSAHEAGQMPYARCLQMILEDDARWKDSVVQKLRWLDDTITKIATMVDLPELQPTRTDAASHHPVSPECQMVSSHDASPTGDTSQPPQTWEVVMEPKGGPASIPAACVSEVRSRLSPSDRPDLISTGVLSLPQALALFDVYYGRLDHFLYRILGDHASLDSIRRASPLLAAAVCTVGALHSNNMGHLFNACYREFKALVAAQSFSTNVNEDDVRGLCIGAFWLHELSWALIGTAVRIASDIKLHHGIYKALNGDRAGYLQARLYYLVYVCDHHFSVAYGRPPMSREGLIIDSATRFLEIEHATEDDARLVSQIKEWSILSQVFDTFGVDVDTPVAPQMLPQLRRYSIALDTWHADWNESFVSNRNVGNYPQKGVGLHFHFAKLYLCSHAFRGAPTQSEPACLMSPEMEEIANTGVLSAMSILRVIVSDAEFRSFLNGLPLYFDTMLAFAVVFLLKVATKYATTIRIDTGKILSLVSQTVASLQEITHAMHPQHILVVIADGLGKLLRKCQEPAQLGRQAAVHPSPEPSHADMVWMENMTNFDFLSNLPDVDDWLFHYNTASAGSAPMLPQ
ncbi:hypothetical protein CFD26_101531 [Aspergillus turcosus]|uniref:Xylanolytic transcriptional activator regulatory domain-containing protein n=1 Tax=Aspergillus turcosus TaxID=1245748 RepID=A0A421D4D6_9EURO|nr:hypothetical protein CFD26_101531 [Aspergillus turcosus]